MYASISVFSLMIYATFCRLKNYFFRDGGGGGGERVHWIEKQSSHGQALEYLDSSGSKAFMNGPIVRKLCVGGNRET